MGVSGFQVCGNLLCSNGIITVKLSLLWAYQFLHDLPLNSHTFPLPQVLSNQYWLLDTPWSSVNVEACPEFRPLYLHICSHFLECSSWSIGNSLTNSTSFVKCNLSVRTSIAFYVNSELPSHLQSSVSLFTSFCVYNSYQLYYTTVIFINLICFYTL